MKRKDNNLNQSKTINIISLILRLVFGAVFIFSGFVKVIDPLGFTYKIEDYLTAFGGFFTYFTPLALPASVFICTLELVIGLNILFKIRYHITTFVALLFMIFMTGLTLYTAIANPVSDCGCFGDAVVISNTATFIKNLFLLAIIITLFVTRKSTYPIFKPVIDWIICIVFFVFGIGLSIHCYRYLPLIDFRPYKIGVNILESMSIPPGEAHDVYQISFIYEKEGTQQEFTLENYPKNDTTWTFVDQKSILVSKGYEPPIHDFSIVDEWQEDITEDVLSTPGYTYLLIVYDLNKSSKAGLINAQKIYEQAILSDKGFYALTASSDNDIEHIRLETGINFPFYTTDPTTLKTIIRSNPGLLLLKDGTIENKWAWRKLSNVIE